jgi:hypothetical protein
MARAVKTKYTDAGEKEHLAEAEREEEKGKLERVVVRGKVEDGVNVRGSSEEVESKLHVYIKAAVLLQRRKRRVIGKLRLSKVLNSEIRK